MEDYYNKNKNILIIKYIDDVDILIIEKIYLKINKVLKKIYKKIK